MASRDIPPATWPPILRIYDTFPFDGELDLLDFRLREIFELVDVIVLVEAAQTYRGDPKPLVFGANRARFDWAAAKIRYVKLDALGRPALTPRARAAVQRNAAMLAMRDLAPEDAVLLLDVDEIPSASLLRGLRTAGAGRSARLLMTRHYQYLDMIGPSSACCPDPAEPFASAKPRRHPSPWPDPGEAWHGRSGVMVRGGMLLGDAAAGVAPATPFDLRFGTALTATIAGAGRHLSSVDPSTRLERKLGRVFHAEWASDRAMRPDHLRRCRDHGVHHRGWWYAETPAGPLPDDLTRLAGAHPGMARGAPLPPIRRRRMVRTWSWLRLWPRWPEWLVDGVDRHFDRLTGILIGPLALAGLARRLRAALGWRGVRETPTHHH